MCTTTTISSVAPPILTDFIELLSEETNKEPNYCCGGLIDDFNLPVIIHYRTKQDRVVKEIQFPPTSTNSDEIQSLIASGEQASFGRGEETIVDLQYRNAISFASQKFTTNFHIPGRVLQQIQRTMMPLTSLIECELYKLNIYQENNFFKAHQDTPRSADMFGSLVVCLPSKFKGGNLLIRYNEKESVFDWQKKRGDREKIQWATFYSDCEHEIERIESGHRVTLTYNLYAKGEPNSQNLSLLPISLSTFPLHTYMKQALLCPTFYKEGIYLGYYCRHFYAHTSSKAAQKATPILSQLKGHDATLFAIAQELKLDVNATAYYDPSNNSYDGKNASESDDSDEGPDKKKRKKTTQVLKKEGKMYTQDTVTIAPLKEPIVEQNQQNPPSTSNVAQSENKATDNQLGNFYDRDGPHTPQRMNYFVRRPFDGIQDGGLGDEDEYCEKYIKRVGKKVKNIIWMNSGANFHEIQDAYGTYGNQPGVGFAYSALVILIKIPNYKERMKNLSSE